MRKLVDLLVGYYNHISHIIDIAFKKFKEMGKSTHLVYILFITSFDI